MLGAGEPQPVCGLHLDLRGDVRAPVGLVRGSHVAASPSDLAPFVGPSTATRLRGRSRTALAWQRSTSGRRRASPGLSPSRQHARATPSRPLAPIATPGHTRMPVSPFIVSMLSAESTGCDRLAPARTHPQSLLLTARLHRPNAWLRGSPERRVPAARGRARQRQQPAPRVTVQAPCETHARAQRSAAIENTVASERRCARTTACSRAGSSATRSPVTAAPASVVSTSDAGTDTGRKGKVGSEVDGVRHAGHTFSRLGDCAVQLRRPRSGVFHRTPRTVGPYSVSLVRRRQCRVSMGTDPDGAFPARCWGRRAVRRPTSFAGWAVWPPAACSTARGATPHRRERAATRPGTKDEQNREGGAMGRHGTDSAAEGGLEAVQRAWRSRFIGDLEDDLEHVTTPAQQVDELLVSLGIPPVAVADGASKVGASARSVWPDGAAPPRARVDSGPSLGIQDRAQPLTAAHERRSRSPDRSARS